jgi:hypothetical protein
MTSIPELLPAAIDRRRDLLLRLHAEGTDCYRLLHGIAEGAPGVTVAGTLRTGERRADFNSWGVDGTNYPDAA